jgi:hypothetical protein
VQEIHIALWRETKYVLLRFNRQGRMRMHQMKGVVQQLHDKFQIVSNEILGYDAITENTRENDDAGGGIKEHPGFKHIVDELKKKKGTIRSWLVDDDELASRSKKRGRCFLQRVVGEDDIERMPRDDLIQKVRDMEEKLQEANAMKETYNALNTQLSLVESENFRLRMIILNQRPAAAAGVGDDSD